jgi:hypothetical protein
VREERPVQELRARIVRVGHVVEHVQHRKIAGCEDKATLVDLAGKLVHLGFPLFSAATQADRLAEKGACAVERRVRAGGLGQLTIGESGQAMQTREGLAERHFRIEVHFSALPQAHAQIKRRRDRIAGGGFA